MITVLYVDDEPTLLEIAQLILEQSGEFRVVTLTSAQDALDSPSIRSCDAIISDYQMPEMDGIAFLKATRERFGDIPFILFTGKGREEVVIEAINNGADFYLQKGGNVTAQFAELSHKIRQAVRRRKAEDAVRVSEDRLQHLIQLAPAALAMFDRDMRYIAASRRWMTDYHLGERDIAGHSHYEIFPEISEGLKAIHRRGLAGEVLSADEDKFVREDGSVQWLAWEVRPWFTTGNAIGGIIIFSEDITKRKQAEEALRQKNEELGAAYEELTATEEELRQNYENLTRQEQALNRRFAALTRPPAESGIAFEELFDLDEIQALQDDFAKATGVAVLLTRPDGAPITKPSNFCRLCSEIVRQTPAGQERCLLSDAEIGGLHEPGRPYIHTCLSAGLWGAGANIVLDGRHIANWLIGQVRNEAQTGEQMRAYAREIGVDEDGFARAFLDVPVMDLAQFEAVARALQTLADQLSKSAYQNVQQARLITGQRASEEALRESERRYRDLFEINHAIMLIVDTETMTVADANAAACRFYGYTPEEMHGMSMTRINTLDLQGIRTAVSQAAVNNGAVFRFRHRKKSGEIRDVEVFSAPVVVGGRRFLHSIIQDITDRKQAEDALLMANRKLTLLSGITRHDIKNQLTALQGFLQLGGEEADKPEVLKNYLSKALAVAGVIDRQISFTKDYEDLGVHSAVWQDVDTLVHGARSALATGAVAVECQAGGIEVFADPLLEKVFYNLIDNSLRYGGETLTSIRIAAEGSDGELRIVYEDDGAGIADGDRKRLFSKGFGKNTGLGLFLSREILSITGIAIAENGEPGRGARFEIAVPAGVWRTKDPEKKL
jgi:PAS domain S-box-containing protein